MLFSCAPQKHFYRARNIRSLPAEESPGRSSGVRTAIRELIARLRRVHASSCVDAAAVERGPSLSVERICIKSSGAIAHPTYCAAAACDGRFYQGSGDEACRRGGKGGHSEGRWAWRMAMVSCRVARRLHGVLTWTAWRTSSPVCVHSASELKRNLTELQRFPWM